MNKNQFLDKWIEALPLNSKDADRKEMSYDLDLLMAKELTAFAEYCQDNYSFEIPDRIIKDYEQIL